MIQLLGCLRCSQHNLRAGKAQTCTPTLQLCYCHLPWPIFQAICSPLTPYHDQTHSPSWSQQSPRTDLPALCPDLPICLFAPAPLPTLSNFGLSMQLLVVANRCTCHTWSKLRQLEVSHINIDGMWWMYIFSESEYTQTAKNNTSCENPPEKMLSTFHIDATCRKSKVKIFQKMVDFILKPSMSFFLEKFCPS